MSTGPLLPLARAVLSAAPSALPGEEDLEAEIELMVGTLVRMGS